MSIVCVADARYSENPPTSSDSLERQWDRNGQVCISFILNMKYTVWVNYY